MQSLRAYRSPRRAISIEALLVWTFRAQRAELEPPRDHDRDRPAVGTEWIIFQQGAVLGCTIDCSRRVLPDRVHDDAETVAAVVVGALDWHTATRVAELARRSMPGRGRRASPRSRPVKGVEGFNRASPVSGPTYVDATDGGRRLRRGARIWTVAVSTFKAETYRFLRLERPTGEEIAGGAQMPPGTIHLPDWVESEWLKQFVAEQLVTVKTKRGFARLEWQRLRERNEALDTRVYARAAAWIAGLDRWSDARWAEAEREIAVERAAAARARRPVQPESSASPDAWLGRRKGWLK